MRIPNFIDHLINEMDTALRTIIPPSARASQRPSPAEQVEEAPLSALEKKHIAGLMRVNHAGEVCAQALYQGQALTAQLTHIKQQMSQAATEEIEHLAWCEQRLAELDSRPSLLNPVWYGGSLFLGALAGLAGDKISLGFVAATEQQVSAHLQKHLQDIPAADKKTRALLEQMQEDEEQHARLAVEAGAVELPFMVKKLMSAVSKLMTNSSYHV